MFVDVEVSEGGEAVITTSHLAIPQNSPIETQSRFVLLSPGFGDIVLDGEEISEFKISDVIEGRLKYIHTSGEIGPEPKHDSVTLSLIDNSLTSIFNAPLVDLNVTIIPVDNQKPSVILGGPVFVQEGESIDLTFDMLTAQDLDTELSHLKFIISVPPVHGFIENMEVDSDQGKGRQTDSFMFRDLKRRHINYVQANHTGIEPTEDFFEVYVSDGTQNSLPAQVRVNIIPVNDEMPMFSVGEITVEEGGKTVLPPEFIQASDADRPNQRLVLSLTSKPQHGQIVIMLPSPSGSGDGFEVICYYLFLNEKCMW